MTKNFEPQNRLREIREAAGMSRAGLADFLGVGEHQVRRYESGEQEIPTKRLLQLREKFGVSSDYLLGVDRDDNEPTKAKAA